MYLSCSDNLCLPLSLSRALSLFSVYLCLSLSISVYLCLSLSLSLSLCVSLSVRRPVDRSVGLSVYLSVCLAVCLSDCLSLTLFFRSLADSFLFVARCRGSRKRGAQAAGLSVVASRDFSTQHVSKAGTSVVQWWGFACQADDRGMVRVRFPWGRAELRAKDATGERRALLRRGVRRLELWDSRRGSLRSAGEVWRLYLPCWWC